MPKSATATAPAIVESVPLSADESADFARHEAAIEKGLGTFIEVGNALLDISERRLYRVAYKEFESYCRERWNFTRARAYQLIEAARINENLSTRVDKPDSDVSMPTSEKQVRPLAGLPPEKQREAWSQASSASKNGKPTPQDVKRAADKVSGRADRKAEPSKPKSAPKTTPKPDPKAVDAVLEEEDEERGSIHGESNGVGPKAAPEPTPASDDRSDGEFLESLPVREKLSPACRKAFDRDALKYRAVTTSAEYGPFRRRAKSVLDEKAPGGGPNGPYHGKLSAFLRIPHPRDWPVCPPSDKGGCGGKGIVGTTGNCGKCFGRGFLIV
jgi:hypothetical protein